MKVDVEVEMEIGMKVRDEVVGVVVVLAHTVLSKVGSCFNCLGRPATHHGNVQYGGHLRGGTINGVIPYMAQK